MAKDEIEEHWNGRNENKRKALRKDRRKKEWANAWNIKQQKIKIKILLLTEKEAKDKRK